MNAWQSLTPWFPIQTPPVRSGVYLVEDALTGSCPFRCFDVDTGRWGAAAYTITEAYKRRPVYTHGAYRNFARWRGIQGE